MFAIWRSCQHYATPESVPDGESGSLDTILAAATILPSHGWARRFIARRYNGGWTAVGFTRGAHLISTTTSAQLVKYERIRRGEIRWSNDNYRALEPSDHPSRTRDLDRKPSK